MLTSAEGATVLCHRMAIMWFLALLPAATGGRQRPQYTPLSAAPVRVNVPATLSCHGSDGGE